MTKLFRIFAVLLAGLLAVSMLTSCGGDDDTVLDEPVPVNFVSAAPPSGSVIAANASITVTFDHPPADVSAGPGIATASGKKVTVAGPFPEGPLSLTVTWADGTQTLTYTVLAPCCAAPIIIGGTVIDGDTDVDPEAINSDGMIEIAFSEEVTGNIALQTEDGDDVGWIGKVAGSIGRLELVKGRELVNETVYVIVGRISTADGTQNDIKITFVTKGKA